MEYLKVWTSFRELLEPLTDAEKGRLFVAMLEYAELGTEPQLSGNERYVWPSARQSINNTREKTEQLKANGSKPKQTEANRSKPEQTQATESKPKQTEANRSSLFDKEKEKVNDKDNYIKENPLKGVKEKVGASAPDRSLDRSFDKFWLLYPRKEGKQDARKAFAKIKPDDDLLNTMLEAVQKQKQSDQWSDPRYIPHPATWLNGRRWEDEPVKAQGKTKQVSAQVYDQRDYSEEELEEKLGLNDLFKGVAG